MSVKRHGTILLSASTASSSRFWRRFASGNSAAISVCSASLLACRVCVSFCSIVLEKKVIAISVCSASLLACVKAVLGAVLGRLCFDFSVQRQLVGLSCLRQFLFSCTSKASNCDFSVEWLLVGLSSASVLVLWYE